MKNATPEWEITEYGLECPKRGYNIAAGRLLETWDDGTYQWPQHMQPKPWINLAEFCDAFCAAIIVHASKCQEWAEFDPDVLRETMKRARYRDDDAQTRRAIRAQWDITDSQNEGPVVLTLAEFVAQHIDP